MAFLSAFDSALNVDGKDIVSCYSPPSGCNVGLKTILLEFYLESAHTRHSHLLQCPTHICSLGGPRL